MKKTLALVLALCLLLCVGCAATDETATSDKTPAADEITTDANPEKAEETADNKDALVIGICNPDGNEYQTALLEGLDKATKAKEFEYVVTNANTSIDKQISDMESLIVQDVDAIILGALDPDGLVSVSEQAVEAGIPVIEQGFGLNTDKVICVGVSPYETGVLHYEYLAAYLDANPDAHLNIGYIWGFQNVQSSQDRYRGLFENLEANYSDRYTIMAEGVTNYVVDDAIALAEDWITAYPEINCLIGQNDEIVIGAINAFEAANLDITNILTLGIDGSVNGQEYIRNGKLMMSCYTDMDKLAEGFVEYAEKMINGETFTENIYVDALVVMTQDNIDEILS